MALMRIDQDGVERKISGSFFRGNVTNFYPHDDSLQGDVIVTDYIVKGWMPAAPFLAKTTPIVAFGSCFAREVQWYLTKNGFNVLTENTGATYVTSMGDGIVNTFAILQQFEWAWENKTPRAELWHGYSAESFGYDEAIRLETKALFDAADCFIITLGLSEIWYDEPTGEVFWRAVPRKLYDPARHKFRVSTFAENYRNLSAIHRLIRKHRPGAAIVFTVSPVPLSATFRDVSCASANSVSKAILRAALDELYREELARDGRCYYFPSYEVVTCFFHHPWTEDRRHIYPHVLDFNMNIFERYFCETGMTDADLLGLFRAAQEKDRAIGREGHLPVDREKQQKKGHRKEARQAAKKEAREERLRQRKLRIAARRKSV